MGLLFLQFHFGIQITVRQINRRIHEKYHDSHDQNVTLNQWIITLADGINDKLANTRISEQHFNYNNSANQATETDAEYCNDRRQTVPEGVKHEDPAFG